MAAFLDSFYSVSVQCLKTPSEALNPQSQADMVTRVFWIAVSLLESDYEHEFLMAIHLLNKVGLRKITKSATDCRTSVSPGVENRLRFKNNKGCIRLVELLLRNWALYIVLILRIMRCSITELQKPGGGLMSLN